MYVKSTTRRTNRRRSTKRTSGYKKRAPLPTRYYGGSRKMYRRRRIIGKQMNTIGETKLVPTKSFDESAPNPIQAGAQAYFFAFNVGTSSIFTNATPVNGIEISQGTAFNERVGNYAYYKKTHFSVKLEMTTSDAGKPPTQFRMIVFKIRRQSSPSGITANFSTDGFLRGDGLSFGHATSGVTGLDLMMQPLNKRDWVIYKDIKFVLQNYNSLNGAPQLIYNHYPAYKDIQLDLPYYKKAYMGGNTGISPTDLNFSYGIVFYAHTLGRDGIAADGFEVSQRGTTSFCDP